MNKSYEVAGHLFEVSGIELCKAVAGIDGFKPFEVAGRDACPDFVFREGVPSEVPSWQEMQYTLEYEGVKGEFGRTQDGYMLCLKPAEEAPLHLWCNWGGTSTFLCGNMSLRLSRFALWVGYGLMTLARNTIAIHSSCIVHEGMAVLFLGESGTGKSTHTRLWREHIPGAYLLNDDSPILRVEEDGIWVYGSPWSGKTPCYKKERYELKGCVRLSQAPYNDIRRLTVLQGYGALHPSCPPEFAYDALLYDAVSRIIGQILSTVPVYHLACLPDAAAAELSCKTLFNLRP